MHWLHSNRTGFCTALALSLSLLTFYSAILTAVETQPQDYHTKGCITVTVNLTAQKPSHSVLAVRQAATLISANRLRETGRLAIPQLTKLQPGDSFAIGQNAQINSLKIMDIATDGNGLAIGWDL